MIFSNYARDENTFKQLYDFINSKNNFIEITDDEKKVLLNLIDELNTAIGALFMVSGIIHDFIDENKISIDAFHTFKEINNNEFNNSIENLIKGCRRSSSINNAILFKADLKTQH